MTERVEWERWRAEWARGTSSQATVSAALARVAKARRDLAYTALIESCVAFGSLAILILALRHAANRFEAVLGLAVGVAIGFIWVQRIVLRRAENASVASSSAEHLSVLRALHLRQARLARSIWIVLALELSFLVPWWVIGTRYHGRQLRSFESWLTVWLPLAVFAALFVWSLRSRRKSRDVVREIEELQADYELESEPERA